MHVALHNTPGEYDPAWMAATGTDAPVPLRSSLFAKAKAVRRNSDTLKHYGLGKAACEEVSVNETASVGGECMWLVGDEDKTEARRCGKTAEFLWQEGQAAGYPPMPLCRGHAQELDRPEEVEPL